LPRESLVRRRKGKHGGIRPFLRQRTLPIPLVVPQRPDPLICGSGGTLHPARRFHHLLLFRLQLKGQLPEIVREAGWPE
jgi:hypothetical protein